MRDDLPAAAFRLACALPARTHEWKPNLSKPTKAYRMKAGVKRGRGTGFACAIMVGRRKFSSIKAAMLALGCGNTRIYEMLNTGEARRL